MTQRIQKRNLLKAISTLKKIHQKSPNFTKYFTNLSLQAEGA